jgi:lactoylglutathione lyase
MRIEHIALWTNDIDRMARFYQAYFGASAGARYVNPAKHFSSCFLSFASGSRLELMSRPGLDSAGPQAAQQRVGCVHVAIAVGSEAAVDALTERLRADGTRIVGEARRTGDGYYESVVEDPDGNLVEITV